MLFLLDYTTRFIVVFISSKIRKRIKQLLFIFEYTLLLEEQLQYFLIEEGQYVRILGCICLKFECAGSKKYFATTLLLFFGLIIKLGGKTN